MFPGHLGAARGEDPQLRFIHIHQVFRIQYTLVVSLQAYKHLYFHYVIISILYSFSNTVDVASIYLVVVYKEACGSTADPSLILIHMYTIIYVYLKYIIYNNM